MRMFPLLQKDDGISITRNPLGCAFFCCLLLFGALVGRAVFANVYEPGARALLAALPSMARPVYRPASVLIAALLPPVSYCACLYLSGLRRALLPLWAAAVLGLGCAWGMRLGAAGALFACGAVAAAWLIVLAPMLVLLPLCAYLALLALRRALRSETDAVAPLLRAVIPSVTLMALATLFQTLSCLYAQNQLFD